MLRQKHKRNARAQVHRAVQNGQLTRPGTCGNCGDVTKVQAHHKNYAKPLLVEWLCATCHLEADQRDGTRPRATVLRPTSISSEEFRSRLLSVYFTLEKTTVDDGVHVWFAAFAQVTPWTVTRWLNGQRRFRGAALSLLEQLEHQAATNGNGKK